MATNINTILSWFKTRSKPTQEQFWASWSSFWHKDEQIPQASISNLTTTLDTKTDQSQFHAHITDDNAHLAAFEKKLDKGDYNGTAQHLKNDIDSVEQNLLENYYTIPKIDSKISEKQDVLTDVNFGTFQNTLTTVSSISDTDKIHFLAGKLTRIISWTNFKNLFKTINGNSIFGTGDVTLGDMTTDTDQSVSGIKTFLNGKFGLRNVANTFSSFFTNINTASRTYTLPDKSGTIALTSDMPTNIVNNGIQNFLGKYNNSNGIVPCRINDDGTRIGINNTKPYSKDFEFGNNANFELGVRQSDTYNIGRDLIVSAGRTINFVESSEFIALNQSFRPWYQMAVNSNTGNVYACGYTHGLYKQTAGSGDFHSIAFTGQLLLGVTVNSSNNDVYASIINGDIYKQTGGIGPFEPIGAGNRQWWSIAVNSSNNDVYAVVYGGDIYKQTGGTGPFVAVGAGNRIWHSIAINSSNNDVYAVVVGSEILKQTGGSGTFNSLGQPPRTWKAITVNSMTNDVFAADGGGDIYKQTNGTGNFIAQGLTARNWNGIAVHSITGDIYASVHTEDIYKQINQATGNPNLDGGILKLKAGTGKGSGESRQEFYTGQKTISGTNMQAETLRFYIDENGFFVYLTPPIYTSDAAADEDTNLPSGAYYKITGDRTLFQKP